MYDKNLETVVRIGIDICMTRTYKPLYVLILTYVWQELTNRCTYWYRHKHGKNLQTVVRIGIDICMTRTYKPLYVLV